MALSALMMSPNISRYRAVEGMGVAHRHHLRVMLMHRGVEHKTGAVDGIFSLLNGAGMIREDEAGHPHVGEMDAHRVGPIEVRKFRVTYCQVACEPVVVAIFGKDAAGGGPR